MNFVNIKNNKQNIMDKLTKEIFSILYLKIVNKECLNNTSIYIDILKYLKWHGNLHLRKILDLKFTSVNSFLTLKNEDKKEILI